VLESRTDGSRRRTRVSLSDEVAAHVRALIISGSLHPGEFVRLEKIADDLGVSATHVREGLHVLRGEGFLDFEPSRSSSGGRCRRRNPWPKARGRPVTG